MKKIIMGIMTLLLLSGCGKVTEKNIIQEFSNKLAKTKSYEIDGKMQIISNEETFSYAINVNYLKDNYYKVVLLNESNNHEQIILRNDEGVFVVTPALNKSFKFQSEWPDNSSQAYILNSVLKDLASSKDVKYEKTNDGYILTTKVNYPNNSTLTYEKVYFDKGVNLKKVEVYNNNDSVCISVVVDKINYKAGLSEEDFYLDNFINEECCLAEETDCMNPCPEQCEKDNCEKESSVLESAIYPLYVPEKSSLTSSEKIETDFGNRLILTFAGDNDFVLVEEASKINDTMEIIPVYGDPQIMASSVVALGANSLYWTDQNVDFYLTSNTLSGEQMLNIASSMANVEVVSQIK